MISVVIPNYNRRDATLALLADIYRQDHVDYEVIVVDDCSSDDSVQAIRGAFPSVKVLVSALNGGPAIARNRGIKEARGEVIVGFDSDVTLPDPTLLAKVAGYFQNPGEVDCLALRILKPDGKSEDVARWWHPLPLNDYADRTFFTSYFSGTAYAFRRAAAVAANLYPEILYMHYEEVELAWRLLDRGGRILYTPELQVIHHANSISRRSEVEVFLKPRNQILLAVSCLPLAEAILYVIPRTTFQFFKACSRWHFAHFLKSMRSVWKLLPQQVARRKPLRRATLTLLSDLKTGKAMLHPHAMELQEPA